MEDFETTVLMPQRQSGKPQILGIAGLGGVGKTTLAKEIFNRKNSDYGQFSCFLFDVRENAAKGCLHLLQRKLMKCLTGGTDIQIDNIDEGTGMLRNHLSSSKALVVLDDVDEVQQVDALFPVRTVPHPNSLILITSRSRDVLRGSRVEESSIYNLTGLNAEHSRELFCLHSFSRAHPLHGFEYLAEKFLKACDGLPLSLIVFGSLVYGKNNPSYWEDQLDRLQRILPTDIKQRLKISYDSLDVEDQHIFLDIACFFIGKNRDMAIRIWDGSGWNGRLGFRNLENRCLINVDCENCIHMHDHIRDLGRDIAESPQLPLRLWRGTENILQQSYVNEQLRREVRGIRLIGEYQYNDSDDQYACFSWWKSWSRDLFGNCVMKIWNILHNRQNRFHGIDMSKLQLLDAEDGLVEPFFWKAGFPNLVWLCWKECHYTSLPSWILTKNLRVLQVVSGQLETLWQGESQAPLQLRVLEISSFLSNIPKSIGQLKHLERIVLSYGRQVIMPEEFCLLQSLAVLVLEYCSEMKSLPDCFGNLSSLQHIELRSCKSLERLPNSFGNLTSLKYLKLWNCDILTLSSDTLGNITTLEHIDLSDCEKIEILPLQVAHQKSLEILHLQGTNLKELPNAIGELSGLEELTLGSHSLDKLPPSLGDLSNLKKLMLIMCKELKCFPSSFRLLTNLTSLTVIDCPLTELPFETVKGERERLGLWSNLDSPIEQCLPRLQHLAACYIEISDLSFPAGVCPNLQILHMWGCSDLVEVGTLPTTLITLYLSECCNLKKIRGLCGLPNLQMLTIGRCRELEELPSIETLISLEKLDARRCVKLKTLSGLGCLTKLQELNVSGCSQLEELPGVEDVRSLVKLDVSQCPKLQWKAGVVEQLHQRLEEFK